MTTTSSAPLLPLAFCLMAGIVVGHVFHLWLSWYWLAASTAMTLLLFRYPGLQSLAIGLTTAVLGCVLLGMEVRQMEGDTGGGQPVGTVDWHPGKQVERSRLWFEIQRERLLQHYQQQGATGDAYAVLAAMSLGDKRALSKDLKHAYAASGASHILALSGLHLGIIYVFLSLLLRGRRWHGVSQVLLVTCIWAFAFLVGLPASVVRSATMLTVYVLLSLGDRKGMSVNVLAFTAIVMLLYSPRQLFDVSFQLSFMAMFAILMFLPYFDSLVSYKYMQRHQLVRWVWSLTIVSLAAQLGTAPLVAYYFGHLPLLFLFTNLIVIPAAYLLLCGCLLMLVLPALTPLVLQIASVLNSSLRWVSSLPCSSISGLHPTVLQVCLCYMLIGVVFLLCVRTRKLI